MDNSLSASSLAPDPPADPPFVCSYVPKARKMDPGTYSLPSTPESDLSFATRLSFAKGSMLSKLGLVSSNLPSPPLTSFPCSLEGPSLFEIR